MHKGFENVDFTLWPSQVAVASPFLSCCDAATSHTFDSAETYSAIDLVRFDILILAAYWA